MNLGYMLGTSLTFLNYSVVSGDDVTTFSLSKILMSKKYWPWFSCFFGHQEVTQTKTSSSSVRSELKRKTR